MYKGLIVSQKVVYLRLSSIQYGLTMMLIVVISGKLTFNMRFAIDSALKDIVCITQSLLTNLR